MDERVTELTEELDAGIEMNREAAAAFLNAVRPEPGVDELTPFGAARPASYADELDALAKRLKAEAGEAKGTGREALALYLLRLQLTVEETSEWAAAMVTGDTVEVLDALVDMRYVNDGHFFTFGLQDVALPAYREVHASNMTKLGEDGRPIIDASGRWVKGPNFRPPDLGQFLPQEDA